MSSNVACSIAQHAFMRVRAGYLPSYKLPRSMLMFGSRINTLRQKLKDAKKNVQDLDKDL